MALRSINYRFVSRILSIMCISEAIIMLLSIIVAFIYREAIFPYMYTIIVYILVGLILAALSKGYKNSNVGRREGMLSVSISWIVVPLIGMLPFIFSGVCNNIIDAFFETISGFTTTGITVFNNVEILPKGILFWRSLLQWQGGLGIVVITLALVPILNSGAGKLYNEETTGITHDRFLPKVKDVAIITCAVYILETIILAVLLFLGPMSFFDAICHSFSTLSTGGFSTYNDSIAHFDSIYVDFVTSLFMFIGGTNIILVYFLLKGQPMKLFRDEEFRWYISCIAIITIISAIWIYQIDIYDSIFDSFRYALFAVISMGTSTGYSTADITTWKPFFWMIALFLMFVNACAGSTAGGMKMSRFAILIKNVINEFKKITHPNIVVPVIFNHKQISSSVVHQILAFCILYFAITILGAIIMLIDGNGFIESLSSSVTCISNSGVSIGEYTNGYFTASGLDKFVMVFMMIAGRLEIFTFITIFTKYFWHK